MTQLLEAQEPEAQPQQGLPPKPRARRRRGTSILSQGEPLVWLTGGSVILCLGMITLLISVVVYQGGRTFWPSEIARIETADGTVLLGEVVKEEAGKGVPTQRLLRTENFDLTFKHHDWVRDDQVVGETLPEWAMLVERHEWGRFYGTAKSLRVGGRDVAEGSEAVWEAFDRVHGEVRQRRAEREWLERVPTGEVADREESARLAAKQVELDHGAGSPEAEEAVREFERIQAECQTEYDRVREEIETLDRINAVYQLVMATAQGEEHALPLDSVVRIVTPNRIGFGGKLGVYIDRWWQFLSDVPRQSNTAGGVFPAILGTVLMTLIMTVLVVPFGVLAALYLREYAKQGYMVSLVRIAVGNLAGVPSIVFGVFGFGFFCRFIGTSIDEIFYGARLPNPTYGKGGLLWASLTLALLTLPVVIVATEEALSAVPNSMREGSYACGATKWQTIRRIVLPRAMPGILTGTILAIARGAGEVAPLMLVGVAAMAPELPSLLHPERSFMHLGFHIYEVGFKSQDSEAARPLVYTTTLLLIAIVVLLNALAIFVRARLRRRFAAAR